MRVEGQGCAKLSEVAEGEQKDGLEDDAGGEKEDAERVEDTEVEKDAEVESEEEAP